MDPNPLRARMGVNPTQVKAFKDSTGNIDYFVVSLEPSGFAVVAGDDLVEPIIAFASQGTFDPIPQNPLYVLLNRDLPGRLAEAREKENQARVQKRKFIPRGLHRRAQGKWARLQAMNATPSTSDASLVSVSDLRVAPFVESRWDQGNVNGTPCYNLYTPVYYLSGCVATAMAQLMRYYPWPLVPVAITSFEIEINGHPTTESLLGGAGIGGTYDWGNMVLAPDANITPTQREAIGALTHDAGVAVGTNYTVWGSSAYNSAVPFALTNTFKFSNARYAYNGSSSYSIPSPNLNHMINPNLDARFPVLLGIVDASTIGHEVVVDGYGYDNATLYHHLNLGWSGTADAWYNLPTISTTNYNFTSAIQCIYNVFPQGSGEIISGRVLDAAGNHVDGAAITATWTGGAPFTATSNSQGIYALAKIPAATTYTITVSKPGSGYVFFPQTVSTGTSVDGNTAVGNRWGIDFVQDFPGITLNQALDNDYLAFTTGGDAPWSGQTAVSFYGGSSGQTGVLGGGQSAWLQTTVVGPGTLSFHWKVSSEAANDLTGTRGDLLEVYVEDVLQPGTISGEVDWQQKNIFVPAGGHTIKWVYSKDPFVGMGSDCGWVDKVSFGKGSIAPVLKVLLLDD